MQLPLIRSEIFRFLALFVALTTSLFSWGRNLQKSECVGPKDAPAKAIYLHGWFPPSGNSGGFYLDLEKQNRDRLEALAHRLGIRIAIPLARYTENKGGKVGPVRTWFDPKGRSGTNEILSNLEKDAANACGPIDHPVTLVGFSDGGFLARNIAMGCNQNIRSHYQSIMMAGAKPRLDGYQKSYQGCPKLFIGAGEKESLVTCVSKGKNGKCLKSVSFEEAAAVTTRHYKNTEVGRYPGGHQLPPDSILERYLQSTPSESNAAPKSDILELEIETTD